MVSETLKLNLNTIPYYKFGYQGIRTTTLFPTISTPPLLLLMPYQLSSLFPISRYHLTSFSLAATKSKPLYTHSPRLVRLRPVRSIVGSLSRLWQRCRGY